MNEPADLTRTVDIETVCFVMGLGIAAYRVRRPLAGDLDHLAAQLLERCRPRARA